MLNPVLLAHALKFYFSLGGGPPSQTPPTSWPSASLTSMDLSKSYSQHVNRSMDGLSDTDGWTVQARLAKVVSCLHKGLSRPEQVGRKNT